MKTQHVYLSLIRSATVRSPFGKTSGPKRQKQKFHKRKYPCTNFSLKIIRKIGGLSNLNKKLEPFLKFASTQALSKVVLIKSAPLNQLHTVAAFISVFPTPIFTTAQQRGLQIRAVNISRFFLHLTFKRTPSKKKMEKQRLSYIQTIHHKTYIP